MAEDKNLTCRDCGKTFVFTAGEQAFFEEKGLSAPIRCPDCRRLRKQQRTTTSPTGFAPSSAPDAGPSSPRGGDSRPAGGDRPSGPPRTTEFVPRAPRSFSDEEDDFRRAPVRKGRPPLAKAGPVKKEAPLAPKEKRANNRRDEEKLLINWKEEVGLEDGENDNWLAGDGE